MKKSIPFYTLLFLTFITRGQTVVNGNITGAPVGNSQLLNATGWSSCSFSPDLCDVGFPGFLASSTVPAVPSPNGGSWVGLASIGGIECAQTTITGLTIGQNYTLCFYGANFGCSSYNALVGQPRVEIGSTSQIFDINQGSFWTLYSMNFTADATTMPLRLYMQNYGLGNSYCGLDGFTVGTAICSILLPVEMIDFKAKAFSSSIELTWKTVSERNNDYFIIERSTDLDNWEFIGQMKGAGNSASELSYLMNDEVSQDDLYYYRCSQVDFDGQQSSAGIIAIHFLNDLSTELSIFPNPTNSSITIKGSKHVLSEVEIYTSVGEKLSIPASAYSSGGLFVDLSSCSEGVFFIRSGALSYRIIKTP